MNTKKHTVNLGSIKGIAMGQGRCFVVGNKEIAVFRQRDGRLFAIQARCPHMKGPLADGICGDNKIICPLHGHKFDLSTGEGSEPGESVRVYEVQEQAGEILLTL